MRKNSIFLRTTLVGLIALTAAGCDDASSTSPGETPQRVVSKNTFDVTRDNAPLATFLFEQFEDNRVTLKITIIANLQAPRTVSFTYTVTFSPRDVTPQTPPWQTEGAVTRMGTGQTVDKGVVARNPAPIDLGTFTMVVANVVINES